MKIARALDNGIRIVVLVLVACSGVAALASQQPEKPPKGMAKYVLVLWRPGAARPGSPEIVKKVPEPDVAKLGGWVLFQRDNQRMILLPKKAAAQLRRHSSVFLLQRLWSGESKEEWGDDAGANNRFDPSADGSNTVRADADTNLQWGPKNYSYDQSGNITAIDVDSYTYDTAGRLIRAVVGGTTESYEYDSFGNLTTMATAGGATVTIPVDSGSNRLSGREYDAAGNVLNAPLRSRSAGWTSGQFTYTWDGANRLVYLGGNLTTRRMLYDASDERVSTWLVTGDSSVPMHWVVRDFEGRPLREFTSSTSSYMNPDWWTWKEDYIYAEGRLVGGESVKWGPSDEYGGARHIHLDHLGSVRMVTKDDRKSVSEHDYYPFGMSETATHQEDILFGGTLEPTIDSFRFGGHQRDFLANSIENTTEYIDYMHARMYDPGLGRSLSIRSST